MKLLAHRLFVEYAEHCVLAVNRGHDGNAEVDGAFGIAVFHPEAAVLRHPALGDIQLAHHLDARNDGGVMLLADGRHGLGEHAVDAELDAHRIVAGLDVNVTGAPLQRGKDGGIDQPDDRADVALRGQPVDGDAVFAAGLVLANHVQREAFAGFFQHALRLLRLLEDFADLRQGGNLGEDALAQQQADLVDHHQLAGIGDGDGQASVFGLIQRHEVVAEHQVDRDLLEQIVVQLEVVQVDELAAIAPRDVLRLVQIVHVGRGSQTGPAISPVRDYRFGFRYFCHSKSSCKRPTKSWTCSNCSTRPSEYSIPRRRSAGKAKSILRRRRPP